MRFLWLFRVDDERRPRARRGRRGQPRGRHRAGSYVPAAFALVSLAALLCLWWLLGKWWPF